VRIIALDVGTKRIGVAMSDPLGIIAQGAKTVLAADEQKALEEILAFAAANEAAEIVVGLPLNMDGTESQMTRFARDFAGKLKEKAPQITIVMRDERLTSLQIERDLIFLDVSREKRKKINDMLAAQIILQNYLDSRRREEEKNV